MKNSLETRLGIFVALAVIAAVLIIEMIGGMDRFSGGVRIHARFRTVQDLKVGDRVKMGGVEIGRVDAITLSSNLVTVTMKVGKDAGVKTDSLASIQFTGLLGQNFVSLSFGSPGDRPVEDGTLLTATEQPDLGAIMTKLDNVASGVENLTKSFSGDTIANILGPLTDFLKDNRQPFTTTISNIQSITTHISRGEGTVGRMIYDEALYAAALNTVSNLQFAADDVRITLAEARKVVDDVNAGHGTLGKLVKDEALYNETIASMTNLKQILEKMNQGQGTVGKLINDQEFYRNAKLTLQKLDKATEGLEDQGPLSVLGIVVNNLF